MKLSKSYFNVKAKSPDDRDRVGWYIFDWSNSPVSTVAIAVFFPLFLKGIAEDFAWNGSPLSPCEGGCDALFCASLIDCRTCVPGVGTRQWSSVQNKIIPVEEKGVPFFSGTISSLSYATGVTSASVVIQAIVFITVGPFADYGSFRKRFLVFSTIVGALASILVVSCDAPNSYVLAGVLFVVCNAAYGASFVFYNAFLPILVEGHPEVLKQTAPHPPEDGIGHDPHSILRVRERVSNGISSRGYLIGYLSGVLSTILAAGLQFAFGSSTANGRLGDRLCILLTGFWWLFFSAFTFLWLRPHPGGPIPKMRHPLRYAILGWESIYLCIRDVVKFKNTFLMLLAYFFYSDAYSTIASVGILVAQSELCMSSTELVLILLLVNLLAATGNAVFFHVQQFFRFHSKSMIMFALGAYAIICVWCLLGTSERMPVGLKNKWESWAISSVHGFVIGAVQSYSRTVFGDLTPIGKEAEYFSMYEITDKGSSWLGPLVIGLVYELTGNVRLGFVYLLLMTVLPMIMVWFFVDHPQGMVAVGRLPAKAPPSSVEAVTPQGPTELCQLSVEEGAKRGSPSPTSRHTPTATAIESEG